MVRKKFHLSKKSERAFLMGIRLGVMTREQMERSLHELASLVDTGGGEVVGQMTHDVRRVDPSTFIGKGKVALLKDAALAADADMVVIDEELTPAQNRNLEDYLGLFVLDRSAVILDIFAKRAHTREGKLQVELAQMQYLAPRLVGRGEMFSQQTGRIGTRGPGETALEYDRRRIKDRIAALRHNIDKVRAHREIQRQKREAIPYALVSLVGYTNAGKSTLMNALTNAGVLVEDKLFATLDPTVRKLKLPSGRYVLLADTVGFIRRLPHQLVDSFMATFEEVARADCLIHVIDGADSDNWTQFGVVERVLNELGLGEKIRVDVVNKCDLNEDCTIGGREAVHISAVSGQGLDKLLMRLDDVLGVGFERVTVKLPQKDARVLSQIYRLGRVNSVKYEDDVIRVDCELHPKYVGKFREYIS